ncbi:hypothetical protein AA313_de0207246 [Arthrobotrys entomopaga]|nr:hypothetical protein AA313_de0207246 [Arthrobotrys entomopaga]
MKFSTTIVTGIALLFGSTGAVPIVKKDDIDLTILQFALTLEHLENAFYKKAIAMMPESDFIAAGFTDDYYSRGLKYIVHDEEDHVRLLTAAITKAGGNPVEACTYEFPFSDVKSFASLSAILEGVGSSAYLGAAPLITSKTYLSVAGSILVTEALHNAIARSTINEIVPGTPYGTALTANPVFTLAAAFIKSCPSTNQALPFKAFPALNTAQSLPAAPGMPFQFSVTEALPSSFFVTFISGNDITSVTPTIASAYNLFATAPQNSGGQAYVLLTSTDLTGGPIDDSKILFGPAIVEFTPDAPTFDPNYIK